MLSRYSQRKISHCHIDPAPLGDAEFDDCTVRFYMTENYKNPKTVLNIRRSGEFLKTEYALWDTYIFGGLSFNFKVTNPEPHTIRRAEKTNSTQ